MDDEPRNNGIKTRKQMPEGRRFQPGNPGRPKGSRNKLCEDFLAAFHEDFKEHGLEAIQRCRIEDNSTYVRSLVALCPKELKVEQEPLAELPDDELERLINLIRGADSASVSAREHPGSPGTTH